MSTITTKEYKGQAVATTLSFTITAIDTSLIVANGSSLPVGTVYPFVLELERGTANFEKILCQPRSGNNVTILTRNYDGTTGPAGGHAAGSSVTHVLDAQSLTDIWLHITDTTRNDHTQYLNRTTDKGVVGDLASIGTTAAVGSTGRWLDAGTTLVVGAGAINNSNQFGAGVVNSAALAASAVTGAKIAAATIASGSFVASAIQSADIGNQQVTATQIANNTITAAQLASKTVTAAQLADKTVTGSQIADGTITQTQVASPQYLIPVQTATPTPLTEGQPWYDYTNHQLKQYAGSTDGWTQYWNYPWGKVIMASSTTPHGSISTITDLLTTGSVTYLANRLIRITSFVPMNSSIGGDSCGLAITNGSNTILAEGNTISNTNSISFGNTVSVVVTTTAGAATYKARGYLGAGSGLVTAGDGSLPYYILVEDIGPAGAPS